MKSYKIIDYLLIINAIFSSLNFDICYLLYCAVEKILEYGTNQFIAVFIPDKYSNTVVRAYKLENLYLFNKLKKF